MSKLQTMSDQQLIGLKRQIGTWISEGSESAIYQLWRVNAEIKRRGMSQPVRSDRDGSEAK